ncbi:hypothetical protein [Cupriavidus basilensis]|uniref:hypothetical protein n=1 Tax=Cupriavidus basilensis TaxID=68895 RepID=UPI0023E8FC38|nr:hypothetical protein [Cupriavidus basilensis]MDF3881024.1 hypothetical protein [Cupriavidus basilensis]
MAGRNRERFEMLEGLGVARVELEGPDLSKRIAEEKQLDAIRDLVGNSTVLDSLAMHRHFSHERYDHPVNQTGVVAGVRHIF